MTESPRREKGITQTEYAKIKGLTKAAINQRIKRGTIGWNGKHGKECRVWDLDEPDDMQSVRIKKIKIDTVLQKEKVTENRKQLMLDFSKVSVQSLVQSFALLSAELKNLHLPDDQISRLNGIITTCITNYSTQMEKSIELFYATGSISAD